MRQIFPNFLLSSGFTIDHPSDGGIRSKEFPSHNLIITYLRLSIQQEGLNILAIMSIECEVSRDLNLDKILKDIVNAESRKISFSYQMHFFNVSYNYLKEVCRDGTEISGSGSGPRQIKFLARAPALAPKWFGALKTECHCLICTIAIFHQHRWGVAKFDG